MKPTANSSKLVKIFTSNDDYSNIVDETIGYGIFTALGVQKMRLILSNSYTHTANYLRKIFARSYLII